MKVIDNFIFYPLGNKVFLLRCDEKKVFVLSNSYKQVLESLVKNNFNVEIKISEQVNNLIQKKVLEYEK